MEFKSGLTRIIGPRPICVINRTLLPPHGQRDRDLIELCELIDRLGEASARAQKLPGTITTSNKLSFTDQKVYLYVERDESRDCAVGFIKVGVKKLFLYDNNGSQREISPLCVLDFYVHESKQRQGYGKLIFDHMLKEENVAPSHLAVDRPSDKFTSFLSKHYKLKVTVPQVNNYVIFEGFFVNRKDRPVKGRRINKSPDEPVVGINSAAYKDQDSFNRRISATNNTRSPVHPAEKSVKYELESLSDIPLARPSSREKLMNNLRNNSPSLQADCKSSSTPETNYQTTEVHDNLPGEVAVLAVINGSRSQSAQNSAYSRHTNVSLPQQYSASNQTDYREPIRSRNAEPNRINTDLLNLHLSKQNSQGHLKVTPTKRTGLNPFDVQSETNRVEDPSEWTRTFHSAGRKTSGNSSWNIFGVPPGYTHVSNRHM